MLVLYSMVGVTLMKCIDWYCSKIDCVITRGENNRFKYNLCKNCRVSREQELCKTCNLGEEMENGQFLCAKDGTYGLI